MSLKTSKKWCIFFAFANLGLAIINESHFNLWIGVAMVGWVAFLDFMIGE